MPRESAALISVSSKESPVLSSRVDISTVAGPSSSHIPVHSDDSNQDEEFHDSSNDPTILADATPSGESEIQGENQELN